MAIETGHYESMMKRTGTVRQEVTHSPADLGARIDLGVMLVLGVLVAWRLIFVLTAPVVDLTFRSTDDSYYYFNVARNIVLGRGVTFDGINATNGFHPLWMLCLLPIYKVFAANHVVALQAVFCMVTVIAGGAFWVAYRCMRDFAGRSAAVVGVCTLLMPICLNPLLNGLETGLLILLLFVLILAVAKYDLLSLRAGMGANALLGVLLAGVFLCRLDTAFIILGLLVAIVLRWLRRVDGERDAASLIRKMLQTGVVSAVFVAPYFAWNLIEYEHLTPISGALKTTFPTVSFGVDRLAKPHFRLGVAQILVPSVFVLLLMMSGGLAKVQASAQGSSALRFSREVLIAMWAGCVLHFLNTALFMNWAVHWWHYASYVPVTVLLGALLFADIHRHLRSARWVVQVAVLSMLGLAAGGLWWDGQRRGTHHEPWYDAAMWANAHLPEDAVVGMTDCGLFGYFCGRPTVNLDGVINGYEYQDALRDGRLSEFLAGCKVTHLADYEVRYRDGTYKIKLPGRLYRHPGGQIKANPGAEVHKSAAYRFHDHDSKVHFTIWELDKLQVIDEATSIAASEEGLEG